MKKKLTIHNSTLIELMVVCTLLVLLMSSVMLFFGKTTKLNQNLAQNAFANQQILLLKQNWRNLVHNTKSAKFAITDNDTKITSDSNSVTFQERSIIFTDGQEKSTLKLSKRIKITFSEEVSENQHLLIMNIHIPSSPFSDTIKEIIRITACPKN